MVKHNEIFNLRRIFFLFFTGIYEVLVFFFWRGYRVRSTGSLGVTGCFCFFLHHWVLNDVSKEFNRTFQISAIFFGFIFFFLVAFVQLLSRAADRREKTKCDENCSFFKKKKKKARETVRLAKQAPRREICNETWATPSGHVMAPSLHPPPTHQNSAITERRNEETEKKTFTFIAGKAVKWWPISVGISQHWLKKETLPDRCRPDAIIRDKKKRKTNEDTMREENLVLKVRPTWHFIPFVWFMAVKALCCFAGFALLRSSVAHFGDFYFPFLFFVCVCVCVCGSAFLFVNPKLTSVVFWFHFIRTYCGRTSSSLDSKRISSSLWWKKNDN